MKRKMIYAAAIEVIASAVCAPIFAAIVCGNVIGNAAGVIYTAAVLHKINNSRGGRWFLREWWRSTLRLEKMLLGN